MQVWTSAESVTTAGPRRSCQHKIALSAAWTAMQKCAATKCADVLLMRSTGSESRDKQPLHSRGWAAGLLAAHRQPDNMRGSWVHMYWEHLWSHMEAIGGSTFASPAPVSSGYMFAESSCDSKLQAQQLVQLSIARWAKLPHGMTSLHPGVGRTCPAWLPTPA